MTVPKHLDSKANGGPAGNGATRLALSAASHDRQSPGEPRQADVPISPELLRVNVPGAIPPQVLDACSIAIRNIGHSSVKRLAVTSCRRRDGRSTIAAGLALTYVREYQRETILVEFDADHASIAETFDVPAAPGVAELIRNEAGLGACLRRVDEGLMVLPVGDGISSRDLFRNGTASRLFQMLDENCEVLVADLPPLTPGSGTVKLADLCGPVAIVIRSGAEQRDEIAAAVACLAGPVYAVLNDLRPKTPQLVRRMLGVRQ
jgi:Mrp family chromosome partitioning ATPase